MTPAITRKRLSRSPEETEEFASALGARLNPGDLVALIGDLGAGKTVFARGLCAGLGVESVVKSPTFVLVREYAGRCAVLHADAYRLDGRSEWEGLGIEERRSVSVVIVEWADRVLPELGSPVLTVWIEDGATEDQRRLTLTGSKQLLDGLPETRGDKP